VNLECALNFIACGFRKEEKERMRGEEEVAMPHQFFLGLPVKKVTGGRNGR